MEFVSRVMILRISRLRREFVTSIKHREVNTTKKKNVRLQGHANTFKKSLHVAIDFGKSL